MDKILSNKYIKLCFVFCACTIVGLITKSSNKGFYNLSINEYFYSKHNQKWRTIANADESNSNCMSAVKEIHGDQSLNLASFNIFKQEFLDGAEKPQKFESVEQYIAYLESQNKSDHVSFTRFYISRGKYYRKFHDYMMTEVSSKKRLKFIFDGYLKYVVKESVREDNLPLSEEPRLKEILLKKIRQDAIEEFLNDKSNLHKILDHKFMDYVKNWAGVIVPYLFGFPPLYIPNLISKPILKRLLKTKDINAFLEEYHNLSDVELARLMRYRRYDQILYVTEFMVAGYFVYYLTQEIIEHFKEGKKAIIDSQMVNEAMAEMNNIVDEFEECSGLNNCMKRNRDLWENSIENKAIVLKTCKEDYDNGLACEEEWE